MKAGYEASTVCDQDLTGTHDPELWEIIQDEERFLITADKEFGNIQKYPPGQHWGVLLLRPQHESIDSYMQLIKTVIKKYSIKDLARKVTVAFHGKIRIRKTFRNFEY
ncbi:MAG: DUF5615 family PIN-like protein [Elusimicrobiota bacterium]|nr:DUF5615 family PIN-like protein [Elusimicrobiota bacterium]